MKPRVVKENEAKITIAMPVPPQIPKDFTSLSQWMECYKDDEVAQEVLKLAEHYNASLEDTYIALYDGEFHHKMIFKSDKIAKRFKKKIEKIKKIKK